MTRDFANATCKALPCAQWSEPFGPGHDICKVAGKIFAAVGAQGVGVTVKCPDEETAEMLRAAGVARKAPYFHKSWVLVPFETADAGEITHRIHVAYDTIRASLPKKLQATLPARP